MPDFRVQQNPGFGNFTGHALQFRANPLIQGAPEQIAEADQIGIDFQQNLY